MWVGGLGVQEVPALRTRLPPLPAIEHVGSPGAVRRVVLERTLAARMPSRTNGRSAARRRSSELRSGLLACSLAFEAARPRRAIWRLRPSTRSKQQLRASCSGTPSPAARGTLTAADTSRSGSPAWSSSLRKCGQTSSREHGRYPARSTLQCSGERGSTELTSLIQQKRNSRWDGSLSGSQRMIESAAIGQARRECPDRGCRRVLDCGRSDRRRRVAVSEPVSRGAKATTRMGGTVEVLQRGRR